MALPSLVATMLVVGMLISGTINTIMSKFQNSSWSIGCNGDIHQFHKPWFQTLIMFVGESCCLIFYGVQQYRERKRLALNALPINSKETDSLLSKKDDSETPDDEPVQKTNPLIFWIPACLDLTGTTLANIGLVYTIASVFQMLRGSIIIFTGILSVVVLKRRLNINNYFGMLITAGGICLVGLASMKNQPESGGHLVLLGDALIICGMLANAVQMIIEEMLLKNRKIPPPKVVGFEGLFGAGMMIVLVLPVIYFIPGNDCGSYENFIDAFLLIGHNGWLVMFILVFLFSIAIYNFFGLSVAQRLSTVHRTFIDALRTISIWGIEMIIFYVSDGVYGEPWSQYSYLQLIGFCMMVLGTFFYNQVIRIPIPDRFLPAFLLPLPETKTAVTE